MTTNALPDLTKGQGGSGGITDIVQLMQSLGPLLGSGKTNISSNTKSSADPTSMGQADELIKQILESVSGDNLDTLTANTLERAKQTFAPNNIAPNAAGVRGYSDTVNKSMKNEAMARASAEAMTVRLNAVNAANKNASGLVEAKLNATKSTQQQQSQQTGPNTAGKLLSLATPLAIAYNQFKNKTSKVPDQTPDPETGANDINSDYGGESTPTDGTGGGFPTQDFGNDSLILLPTQSEVPLPLDFGSDPLIADSISADAPSDIDPSLVDTTPTDIPGADSPDFSPDVSDTATDSSDSIFSDIDFSDFFADGGVVPGKRPKPGSYEEGALPSNNRSAIGTLATTVPTPINPTPINTRRVSRETITPEELLTNEGGVDAGQFSSINNAEGPPPGLSLGLGIATSMMGAGIPLGLVFSLFTQLSKIQDSSQGPDTSLGVAIANSRDQNGPEQGAEQGDEGAANAANQDSAEAAGGGPSGNEGDNGGGTGSSGEGSGSDDGGAGAGNDGGGSGGDDGGGDDGGGGEFDGGIQDSDSRMESTGIDKKIIHVTPGESVLPVDTTKALQALFGPDVIDQIIAATHTPVRKKANGRR